MNNDLKILHVLNNLGSGGAENYTVNLINSLYQQGIPSVILADTPHTIRSKLEYDVPVIALGLHPGEGKSLMKYANMVRVGIPKIADIIRQERIDVVHTLLAASSLPAWLAAQGARVPVVHTTMHVFSGAGGLEKKLFQARLPGRLVNQFVALSGFLEHELKTQWRIPAQKVRLIRSGIDINNHVPNSALRPGLRKEWGIPKDASVAGIVSRFFPIKCVDLAIQALCVARAKYGIDAHLVLAGDGPEREHLVQLASRLGVSSFVHFIGYHPKSQEILPGFDFYLQTTKGPNLGFSALEAMACAVPLLIAARDADEIKMADDTLVIPESGWVSAADPDKIAQVWFEISSDHGKLTQKSTVAHKVAVEKYAWSSHVDKVIEMYRGIKHHCA
jgi:glycosyltransferase involved in cell wall biosynthesis